MARIAKALDVLRSQINAKYPNRSKVSDGWIGDTAHAARPSDHNPNGAGVVTALDLTHDPAHGVDTWKIAEVLRQRKDPRIKNVISNGSIFSSEVSPWVWRTYTGPNKHAHHVHISVSANSALYDLATPWALEATGTVAPAPTTPRPKGVTEAMRQRMMKVILGYEDNPAAGGAPITVTMIDGEPEIAGITQKNHPATYARLKGLMDSGLQSQLRAGILQYYDQYTDPAQNWTDRAGVEFFLRDCIMNRGPTGAAEILQMALGVEVDHQIGPTTRGALAALDPYVAIDILRAAREHYENKHFNGGEGKAWRIARGQWQGLVNRWNKAQAQAKAFQKEQGAFPVGTTVGVGTGGGAAVVAYTFWDWITSHIIPSIIIFGGLVAVTVFIIRKIKGD